MNQQPQQPGAGVVNDAFCDQVFRALVKSGVVVPETVEEVKHAMADTSQERQTLPTHLRDSAKALARLKKRSEPTAEKIIPMPVNYYAETLEELRSAARKGEGISQTVEERMRANRQRARHER